jgi:hypothetical protein
MVDFKKKKTLMQRLKEKREKLKRGEGGFKYLAIKEGSLRVRHLPVGEENDWSIEATCFWLGMKLGLVVSPVTLGGKCALMKAYTRLSASKDADDRELAKRFKPSRKYFSPVLAYSDPKGGEFDMEQGPKLLIMGAKLLGQAVDLWMDEDDGGDFTAEKGGYDIKYKRIGKGKNDTEYSLVKGKESGLPKALRGKTWSPEEMLKEIMPTYEETKEKLDEFLNLPPEDEEDEAPRKSKTKKKKRSKDL